MLISRPKKKWISVVVLLLPVAVYATKWMPPSAASRAVLDACYGYSSKAAGWEPMKDGIASASVAVAACEKASVLWTRESNAAKYNLASVRKLKASMEDTKNKIEAVYALAKEDNFIDSRSELVKIKTLGTEEIGEVLNQIEKYELEYVDRETHRFLSVGNFDAAESVVRSSSISEPQRSAYMDWTRFAIFEPRDNVKYILKLRKKHANDVIFKNENARRIVENYFMNCEYAPGRIVPLDAILYAAIETFPLKKNRLVYTVDSIGDEVRINVSAYLLNGNLFDERMAFEINHWGDLHSQESPMALEATCRGSVGNIWLTVGKKAYSLSANSE